MFNWSIFFIVGSMVLLTLLTIYFFLKAEMMRRFISGYEQLMLKNYELMRSKTFKSKSEKNSQEVL